MANKRDLKKALNNMVYELVDECYSIQLYAPEKAEASDKVITETASFHETALSKIGKAKNKAEFKAIIEEIEKNADILFDKVNDL